jgi:hypothetical protein
VTTDGLDRGRAVARIYERDMDLVLVEELESNGEFRCWLATRVFGVDCFAAHVGAVHSVVDESSRESDVVFVFMARGRGGPEDPEKLAILVENKIDAVAQPNQGRDYRHRGEQGREQGYWQDFRTCLVAPRSYLEAAADRGSYDESISYEEILAFFASRKERDERFAWKARLVADAIFKRVSGYAPQISEAATAFARAYYAVATRLYPRLQMAEPAPRPAGSTWMSFRPALLPRGASIEHQLRAGAVKLFIPGTASRQEELAAAMRPHLPMDVQLVPGQKSLALVCQVPVIGTLECAYGQVAAQAEAGMAAADVLLQVVERMQSAGLRLD